MEIEYKNGLKFDDIKAGQLFKHNNSIYIKCYNMKTLPSLSEAVNLLTGEIMLMCGGCNVQLVDAKLVVDEK